ncbi:methionine aminopeptidase family protein [Caldicellulosiruptor morganii]|uniref:Uncharacterized protein n=1 Tax=Caldicellulosiruptor morganii TaxID=1387555 RepID=A0ABY7BPU9_9FIRM|nr:hypothetical protein [Caldicellulosiruptor morganii]WAM34076.1 hypothetical protein OTK00_000232 [Caldicellulosiruptor morganii]
MNDEKLDNLFEEAFRVEYRKEFKEELKNVLLEEYDKRKKGRFFIRFSTAAAACLVLGILLFLSFKLNIKGNFEVTNTSFVKNEIEQALNLNPAKDIEKHEENFAESNQKEDPKDKSTLQGNKTSNQNIEKGSIPEASQENSRSLNREDNQKNYQKQQNKKPSTNNSSAESKKKASLAVKNQAVKNNSSKLRTEKSTKSKAVENANTKDKNGDVESSSIAKNPKNADRVNITSVHENSKVIKEEPYEKVNQQKSKMIFFASQVSSSVYALKEKVLELTEEDIAESLSNSVFAENYQQNFQDTTLGSVYINIYNDYCYFEVVNSQDLKVLDDIQQDVENRVYTETENILKGLGLENYSISVVKEDDIYRVNIIFSYSGYEIYDSQSYIEFDRFGKVKNGKVYLKVFLPFKEVEIFDIQTAAEEFKRRYKLEDIDMSKLKLVYKKQGDVYLPVYIYINENKIYWLEK